MKRDKTQIALIRERAAAMIEREPAPGLFLLGRDQDFQVCCWEPSCGLMLLIIEDDLLSAACASHLLENGALRFGSDEEALAHARSHNWPTSKPPHV